MKNSREKTETIGSVVLNYHYYSGKDYYSEGVSEDILLDIVQNYRESEYEHVIQNTRSWSVMYHLSYIRENIVSWLPITKEDTVLEIGAGCGAITGQLSNMAKKVTCIELSKKRSLINAHRHKEYDNIEIVVGNFKDIEPEITEKYDYISLIGVLEYAQSYIGGDNPYHDFLKTVGKHLKDDGKLIIAIENKFGLKYFAGCKEDHLGTYYGGIEGYSKDAGVRTFSKKKLEKIVRECGYQPKFYYPYPDYKLPHTIYSDEYLPSMGELTTNMRNFDADRVVTFDEAKGFDSIIEEGDFDYFSNSFFVLASFDDLSKCTRQLPLYAKYANERSKEFRVATIIQQDEDRKRHVYKMALDKETNRHIEMICENYKSLCDLYEGTVLVPNVCTFIEGIEPAPAIVGVSKRARHKVELEFIKGITLENYLDQLDEQGEYEKMLALILRYCDTLYQIKGCREFRNSKEFEEIFGKREFNEKYQVAPICNYDMIFSNIVFDEQKKENGPWNVLDYEWMFRFDVPIKFVVFRSLYYYMLNRMNSGFASYLAAQNTTIYEKCLISGKETELFEEMEHCFQVSIIRGVASLEVMQVMMPTSTINVQNMIKAGEYLRDLETPKIYLDFGDGFNNADQIYVLGQVDEGQQVFLDIPVEAGVLGVRIDPTEYPCFVHVDNIEYVMSDGKKQSVDRYLINGLEAAEKTIFYDTSDAQIVLEQLPRGTKMIHMQYHVTIVPGEFFKEIRQLFQARRDARIEHAKPSVVDKVMYKCKIKTPQILPAGYYYNKDEVKKD